MDAEALSAYANSFGRGQGRGRGRGRGRGSRMNEDRNNRDQERRPQHFRNGRDREQKNSTYRSSSSHAPFKVENAPDLWGSERAEVPHKNTFPDFPGYQHEEMRGSPHDNAPRGSYSRQQSNGGWRDKGRSPRDRARSDTMETDTTAYQYPHWGNSAFNPTLQYSPAGMQYQGGIVPGVYPSGQVFAPNLPNNPDSSGPLASILASIQQQRPAAPLVNSNNSIWNQSAVFLNPALLAQFSTAANVPVPGGPGIGAVGLSQTEAQRNALFQLRQNYG
ncbi:hypothetical protein M427DRAFT_416015 [Gonapodya prolifera JEL478]|uniref:Uncharacterized protein n=1 Tax=Gonapodya prolifera (strain JEL478) TaxID=1344416 RepID=A0A139A5I9_GONPJ|nr:hypothetical protein M427DRAFT_416015 [Gonapodya prolifera JEL478]|eukprot:KXS11899.1 hypothetical protein M427DRAFT_416015 [Gonapodya prolifera JEL478]